VRFPRATHLVVACTGDTEKVLKGIRAVLKGLKLRLNEEKTRVVDARREAFDFLGFTVKVVKNPRTGKIFPFIRPSKAAMAEVRKEIKVLTCRSAHSLPTEVVIRKLNEVVRGWVGYFRYANCSRDLSQLKGYLGERVRIYLRRKRAKKGRGYKIYTYRYLHETLGLYKIPTSVPWTQPAKAAG